MALDRTNDAHPAAPSRDLVLSAAHTPTTLAAWHCDPTDPIEFLSALGEQE